MKQGRCRARPWILLATTLCAQSQLSACSQKEGGSSIGGSAAASGNGAQAGQSASLLGSGGGGAGARSGSGGQASGGQAVITTPGAGSAGRSSGSEVEETCASTEQTAKRLPLDIYIMLDISDSMNELAGESSKWDAVKSALSQFLSAPESAGIGVGIQYFPLPGTEVPESCTSHADCGQYGPCFISFCKGAAGFVGCSRDAQCRTTDDDFGPCVPLTYCEDALNLELCHDDGDCLIGACTEMRECSVSQNICSTVGQRCSNSGGTCQSGLHSFCTNPYTCEPARYATPAVPIAALPGAAPNIARSIAAQTPDGTTPTLPALEGALTHARSFALAHADHTVAALLATDGLPTLCIADPEADPSGISEVERVAAASASASPKVPTFVIGVFSPDELNAQPNLNRIARAGGTERAFLVDTSGNVSTQFLSALNAIRSSRLSCEFQLPDPPSGQFLDFSLINVDFTSGSETVRLFNVRDATACGESGGWYYDVNPSRNSEPTRILICDSTCQDFQKSSDAQVSIALGCQTLIK